MHIVIGIAIFLTLVLLIEGGVFAYRTIHNPERKTIRRRLQALSAGRTGSEPIDILRKRALLSEVPWFNALLVNIPGMQALGRSLEQAASRYTVGVFLLFSVLLAVIGFVLGAFVINNGLFRLLGAGLCGMAPCMYVYRQKQQRLLKFQRQLPEALDLIARALRAGHTFLVGMKMICEEFSEPISTEFEQTVAEINFGIGVPEALKSLASRVDCPDLNFFVISILVQRETGGNLAEIAESISRLIRKRFELQDRVRVLSAEGRLSAIILFALPFFLGLVISFVSPGYLGVLFTDPIGKGMASAAFVIMLVGAIVIKKMVVIKV